MPGLTTKQFYSSLRAGAPNKSLHLCYTGSMTIASAVISVIRGAA